MPTTDLRMLVAEAGKATEELRGVLNRMARLTYESSAPSNAKKLTPREVQEIRGMKQRGWTNVEIAECYDVNPATVSRIVRGQYHKAVA